MRILTIFIFSLLYGCSNSVEENQGALANIPITGAVLNGNVRYAKVQLVGVDQYGQPQRDADGEYQGDIYYTDSDGEYAAYIQGAYVGPLLAVVQSDEYDVVLQAATDTSEAVIESRKTQIRCGLSEGCLGEAGEFVLYGNWYALPDNFELWSLVNDAQDLSELNISVLTHLSAKLAFSEFQWDGTGTCDSTNCEGTIAINSMITPQKIHEANTRLQGIFGLDTGIANYINSFSLFSDVETAIDSQDQAKVGLLNLTWQYRVREDVSSLMDVLNSWLEESFLKNQGQLYENSETSAPTQWDLATAYNDAIAVRNELSIVNVSLDVAISAMQTAMTGFSDRVTTVQGGQYSETLDAKITSAKQTVSKVQGWLLDYESKNFVNFFDEETAQQISDVETQWEVFQSVLAPELQSVFNPMVQLVDYALLCIATQTSDTSCNISDTYVFDDISASVTFNGVTNEFVYQSTSQPNTIISGELSSQGEPGLTKVFTFNGDINVETNTGLGVVQSRADNRASIRVTLEEAIVAGQTPIISSIEIDWPKLTLKAKDAVNGGYQDFDFVAQDIALNLIGVEDPWRVDEPIHFNIESANISGEFSDDNNKVLLNLTLTSSNATLHYPSTRFPNMDFVWRSTDFKRFMALENNAMDDAKFAAWLSMPSDVVLGETLSSAVQYIEIDSYSLLSAALQNEMALDNLFAFEFAQLTYPGGATGLAVYRQNSSGLSLIKQCEESNGQWSCSEAAKLSDLGCETSFSENAGFSESASVAEAFLFLKNDVNDDGVGCIPQVKIVGRGVYDIEYGSLGAFNHGDVFDVTLSEPTLLGLSAFSVRLISNENNSGSSPIYFNITGGITDPENVNLLISLTHGYYGVGNSGVLGLEAVIPFGERTLWFLLGKDNTEYSDALVYLIVDDQVELTMTAFDYASGYEDHNQPLGYIRYDQSLVGTLSKENGLYVVRYVDGSWQLL